MFEWCVRVCVCGVCVRKEGGGNQEESSISTSHWQQ